MAYRGVFPSPSSLPLPCPAFFGFGPTYNIYRGSYLGSGLAGQRQTHFGNDNGKGLGLGFKGQRFLLVPAAPGWNIHLVWGYILSSFL